MTPERALQLHQPFVHDLVGVFSAPVQAWSTAEGSMRGVGAHGIYIGDSRILSDLHCEADGAELSPLGTQVHSAREVVFRDVVSAPEAGGDLIAVLERTRTADDASIRERLRLVSHDDRPRRLTLRCGLVTDCASMSAVKDPELLRALGTARPTAGIDGTVAQWPVGTEGGSARLDVSDGSSHLTTDGAVVTWTVELEAPAGGEAVATWRLDLHDPAVPFAAPSEMWAGASHRATPTPASAPSPAQPQPSSGESAPVSPGSPPTSPESRAVELLLRRSLSDLDALRLQIPGDPTQTFFAAGAPWFFTLFGRDSLLAASLALPVDSTIAEGTLRTLARRQGTDVDVETAQQPGKILHEVRAQGMSLGATSLPPVYYGTIDATPLWIELLHDARAVGMDDELLAELRPALEGAARWLLEYADADGDGLLEYLDESGRGLANQGWKDSGDSIRFADGSLAEGTIALAEVQGYAYAAALHAADLLEEIDGAVVAASDRRPDLPGGLPERLRAWARILRDRFQDAFWCEDDLGRYVALALDGGKRPVTGVASNMGHLLGTGILDAAQERLVVDRLLHPSMFSGYGIRTLSTTHTGYGPLRYHGGSVWTHDTGYILRGMLRAGFDAEAQVIARGLLRAADGFDQRLPELFSGQGRDEVDPPLPYPASCRPQAWAAASAVPVAQALGVLPRS
ncbi:glycogen debranching N-terminal domain-containing protein [Brachybacterium sp. FME24]|uniref:glycogen debranching N-terminal domain-containing protein n=1 Tax=Brachybacterium sp. FME24 TaxID=2742605 RepID=UPI0027154935|nr:glycogen debranching N-terminal domain-containing protein [Brachybacterium sp. FME24]